MTAEKFWYYIDLTLVSLGIGHLGGVLYLEKSTDILIDLLAALEIEAIYGFESQLQAVLKHLEQPPILNNFQVLYPSEVHSNDAFLYFRCWLIAQGKERIDRLLEGEQLKYEGLPQLENLLYVADEAFVKGGYEGVLPRERT